MPVGTKAHASNLSHHPFPDLTERLSMSIADRGRSRRPARCPLPYSEFEPSFLISFGRRYNFRWTPIFFHRSVSACFGRHAATLPFHPAPPAPVPCFTTMARRSILEIISPLYPSPASGDETAIRAAIRAPAPLFVASLAPWRMTVLGSRQR